MNISGLMGSICGALTMYWIAVGSAMAATGDNFDDAVKDAALWDADVIVGGAMLTEADGHVAYTAAATTASAAWPWHTLQSAVEPWTITVDVQVALPELNGAFESGRVAVGLFAVPQLFDSPSVFANAVGFSLNATNDEVEVEESGWEFEIHNADDAFTPGGTATGLTEARLRLVFEPTATGLLTSSYAPIGSNDFTTLGSTIVSEEGGGYDSFVVGIAGWSSGANVQAGGATLDNFNVGVVPEPATLLVLGIVGFAAIGRQR